MNPAPNTETLYIYRLLYHLFQFNNVKRLFQQAIRTCFFAKRFHIAVCAEKNNHYVFKCILAFYVLYGFYATHIGQPVVH